MTKRQLILIFFALLILKWNISSATETKEIKTILKTAWDVQFDDADSAEKLVLFAEKEFLKNKSNLNADTILYFLAEINNQKGVIHYLTDEYPEAIKFYNLSLEAKLKQKDTVGIAMSYNNIAVAYQYMGDYESAIEYHYKAFKLRNAVKDENGKAMSLNNIGLIYKDQQLYLDAKEHFEKAFRIAEKLDNSNLKGSVYNNLGAVCGALKEYVKAIEYFNLSYKIDSARNNAMGMVVALSNIANAYESQNRLNESKVILNSALKIAQEHNLKKGKAIVYKNLSQVYAKENKLGSALEAAQKSYKYYKEISDLYGQKLILENLFDLYNRTGNSKMAFQYLKEFVSLKDSLSDMDKKEALLKKTMMFDMEQQKIMDSLDYIKKEQIHLVKEAKQTAIIEKNRTQLVAMILGLVLIIIFSIFIYSRYKITIRQKSIIQEQKHIVDEKNEELNQLIEEIEAQRDQIEFQKHKIETAHEEVKASINYAERIQNALFDNQEHWENISNQHFVLFKPRDIVSGDFYWAYSINDLAIWAVADCTGHGVPGAFMSMLGVSFLNEIVAEGGETDAGIILDKLRTKIIKSFEQKNTEYERKDGMDIALCVWNKKTNILQYAGAYNPLWIVRKDSTDLSETTNDKIKITEQNEIFLFELKADRMPIGKHHKEDVPFTVQEIKLQKEDKLYIFSDGFQDQFGGEDGGKYLSSRMKEFVLSIQNLNIEEQKNAFDTESKNWMLKSNATQIDDICVVGIQVL